MNKTIEVQDLNNILASIAIAIKTKPSTTELVLGQLIHYSENGMITSPAIIGTKVCEDIAITPVNYRAAISKLTKMKLISRDNSVIILSPLVKTPFKQIVLREK